MEEMIRTLIEKGYAYAAEDGTVYYRVRSFKDYGKLSHKNLDDLEGGKRPCWFPVQTRRKIRWILSSGSPKRGRAFLEIPVVRRQTGLAH